ncbi:MAG: hypothetical protein WC680_07135 [Sulfuricurvum sp.]|jgi:hypothetical protein
MHSRKESFIGLASSDNLRIALHYREAFDILYDSDKYQDQIVIPALFIVRQFLELGLKFNIEKLKNISNSKNLTHELNDTHDLKKLHNSFVEHYKCAKKHLKKNGLKDKKFLDDLKLLVDCIEIFDNNSMGYRYSQAKNGQKMIHSDATYNLEEVKKSLENTATFLSAIEDIFELDNTQ